VSIISNFTAEPNRVEMLLDYLRSTTRQHTKQELEDLFSPSNARGSTSVFIEVYRVIDSLGLIKIENDLVILNIEKTKKSTYQILKEAIFNKEFLERDNIGQAIAWLQTQTSIDALGWSDKVEQNVNADLDDNFTKFSLTNNSTWQHFGYWCIYLGFATKISIADKDYICPDPTKSIADELAKIFKEKKELTIKDFFESISRELPVLEFGHIRRKINESIREGLKLADNQLSFATSLALLRLVERKIIKLEHKSDANSMSIQDAINNKIISHIIYLGK
jgi:hypothetical protein